MNNRLIYDPKKHSFEYYTYLLQKKIKKTKIGNFFHFRSDPESDPDPLFPEVDPRIRIQIQNEADPKH